MSKVILNILLGMVLFTACKDDKAEKPGQQFQENFLLQNEIGGYLQGNAVFVYEAGENQLAYTTDGLQCRIQTDNQDKYLAFVLPEKPVPGQMVKVQVVAKSVDGMASGKPLCQVLRNDGGKCWLWEPDSDIGYLLKTGE